MEPMPQSKSVSTRAARSLAVLTALGAPFAPTPAGAAHDDSSSSIRDRDNNDHDVQPHNLEDAGNIACVQGTADLNDESEVNTDWMETTDVQCYDLNLGDLNLGGDTWCFDVHLFWGECDQYEVRINTHTVAWLPPYNSAEKGYLKTTGCHEIGHTASIGHRFPSDDAGETSCMRTNTIYQNLNYDAHDTNAINASA